MAIMYLSQTIFEKYLKVWTTSVSGHPKPYHNRSLWREPMMACYLIAVLPALFWILCKSPKLLHFFLQHPCLAHSNISNTGFYLDFSCTGWVENNSPFESEAAAQGQGGWGRWSYLSWFIRHKQQLYRTTANTFMFLYVGISEFGNFFGRKYVF